MSQEITFPITFPLFEGTPTQSMAMFGVFIDWDADDDFLDEDEELSRDTYSVVIERGRDSDLDTCMVGSARISLYNHQRQYVPENTASPLYGLLAPGRKVRISEYDGTHTHELFNGVVEDIQPSAMGRTAEIPCVDAMADFAVQKCRVMLEEYKESGYLVGKALDFAGFPAGTRDIAAGAETFALVYAENPTVRKFIQDIEASEFGLAYIGHDGYLHWEGRYYRILNERCTQNQFVLTGGNILDLEPGMSLAAIKNKVTIISRPREKAASLGTIWTCQENLTNGNPFYIGPGLSKVLWCEYADVTGKNNIASEVVVPVATTDYLANASASGIGTNLTSVVTCAGDIYADTMKLTITNTGGTGAYILRLKIRGKIFTDMGDLSVTEQDAPSIALYGTREFPGGGIVLPFAVSEASMRAMAQYILGMRKAPVPSYKVKVSSLSGDTIHEQIRTRRISDRIHVASSKFNVNGDFYIDKIRHEIKTNDREHNCWWTLSRADSYSYWQLGVSQLGTGTGSRTKLAY